MLDNIILEMEVQLTGNPKSFYARDMIATRVRGQFGSPPDTVFFDGHKYKLSSFDFDHYAYYDRLSETTLTTMEASIVERDIQRQNPSG